MACQKAITLINAATVTTTGNGTETTLPIKARAWVGFLSVGTITGTSPTLDVVIEHSADNANWVTLVSFTQLTGVSSNTAEHKFAASATDYLRPLLPYVRARRTIGGSDTPTFNNVTVKLFLDE